MADLPGEKDRDRQPRDWWEDLVSSGLLTEPDCARYRGVAEQAGREGIFDRLLADGLLTDWQAERLRSGRSLAKVGKLLIASPLDKLPFGTLFHALHLQLRQPVRLVRLEGNWDPADLMATCRHLATLDIWALTQLLDAESVGRHVYLSYEWADGVTLGQWQPPANVDPLLAVLTVVEQIVHAVQAAHLRQVADGVLTAQRIVVAGAVVKLREFGLDSALQTVGENAARNRDQVAQSSGSRPLSSVRDGRFEAARTADWRAVAGIVEPWFAADNSTMSALRADKRGAALRHWVAWLKKAFDESDSEAHTGRGLQRPASREVYERLMQASLVLAKPGSIIPVDRTRTTGTTPETLEGLSELSADARINAKLHREGAEGNRELLPESQRSSLAEHVRSKERQWRQQIISAAVAATLVALILFVFVQILMKVGRLSVAVSSSASDQRTARSDAPPVSLTPPLNAPASLPQPAETPNSAPEDLADAMNSQSSAAGRALPAGSEGNSAEEPESEGMPDTPNAGLVNIDLVDAIDIASLLTGRDPGPSLILGQLESTGPVTCELAWTACLTDDVPRAWQFEAEEDRRWHWSLRPPQGTGEAAAMLAVELSADGQLTVRRVQELEVSDEQAAQLVNGWLDMQCDGQHHAIALRVPRQVAAWPIQLGVGAQRERYDLPFPPPSGLRFRIEERSGPTAQAELLGEPAIESGRGQVVLQWAVDGEPLLRFDLEVTLGQRLVLRGVPYLVRAGGERPELFSPSVARALATQLSVGTQQVERLGRERSVLDQNPAYQRLNGSQREAFRRQLDAQITASETATRQLQQAMSLFEEVNRDGRLGFHVFAQLEQRELTILRATPDP